MEKKIRIKKFNRLILLRKMVQKHYFKSILELKLISKISISRIFLK